MKHLKESNQSYIEHLMFASKVGLTLIFRGAVFLLHALAPVCRIPKKWNLENTSLTLFRWNEDLSKRKNT